MQRSPPIILHVSNNNKYDDFPGYSTKKAKNKISHHAYSDECILLPRRRC